MSLLAVGVPFYSYEKWAHSSTLAGACVGMTINITNILSSSSASSSRRRRRGRRRLRLRCRRR